MIVVGLMVGTSNENISVAVCEITGSPPALRAEVLSSLSIPWPVDLSKMVYDIRQPVEIDIADLCLVDTAVGEAFAAATLEGIAAAGYYPEQVDLVGLQGPSIRHEVRDDGHVMASIQLGQAAIVTEWTGITTVSDFRQRDIAAGGQGAPLFGYADWLLLRDRDRCRAVQYMNGTASMVILPALRQVGVQPVAFEVGPGTALIDAIEAQLNALPPASLHSGDEAVHEGLMAFLLDSPFLRRRPPKSLSHFAYTQSFADTLWLHACNISVPPASILETAVAFTVRCLTDACERFSPVPVEEIILAGKGRSHPHLARRLREAFAPTPIITHEDLGMDSDSKLALSMATLAYEAWHNRPCTLPSLTGARDAIPLGAIIPGENYQRLLQQTWG